MKKKDNALILLCWLVYAGAYLGRYSYSSNISQIMASYGVTHAQAGIAATFFFFSYGSVQFVSGFFCKRINKRAAVAAALLVSALANLCVFFEPPFASVKYYWVVNGAAQSILWPCLVSVLAENLSGEMLDRAVVITSTTVVAGTLLAYGVSAALAVRNAFRFSFLVGAAGMSVIAAVWFLFYNSACSGNDSEDGERRELNARNNSFRGRLVPFIALLCVFAVINNIIRDGLTSWLPSILKEKYSLADSLSILLTVTLPLLSFGGTFFAVRLSRKIKDFALLIGALFALAAAFLGAVVGMVDLPYWLPALIAFGFTCLMMHGINNVITSMIPLHLRDKADPGMLAGILNGCCTVGSTISAYAIGAAADSAGWDSVFRLLLLLCSVPVIAAAVYLLPSAIEKRRRSGKAW